ncbi:hypothetical protein [Gelidibacter japonicus]|uniref:hypothetical protein n=1 Tax=Gelidibacter japonicus TaxID=1962232 RepID=UPI003A8EB9F8
MIVHLHEYIEGHPVNCRWCLFQKIRRARQMGGEGRILTLIRNHYSRLAEEIIAQCRLITNNFSHEVLVTNIASNTLDVFEPILDLLDSNNENIHIVKDIMIKLDNRNFGENRNIPCMDRMNWIGIDENIVPDNIEEFRNVILIDDVFDSGCSYQIAKSKLLELGVVSERISLITILKIRPQFN